MALGENCSSACVTRDHETFGACLKAKSFTVGYCGVGGLDASAQKRWDADLDLYKSARAQGIQPASTQRGAVEQALKLSDMTGTAWRSDRSTL